MNRKNNLESSQLKDSSILLTNASNACKASNPRVNKEKMILKPIDLANKIKGMIDSLERMSVPVVGDFYMKRKKLSKITHSSEIKKNIHKMRDSIFKTTKQLDKEKHHNPENLAKEKNQSNLSKQQENKNLSAFKSNNSTEDSGSIPKNSIMNTKSVFKNAFFLSPFNMNFKNSKHYNSKSSNKMKTGINFSKTGFKLTKSQTINNFQEGMNHSSLTNINISPNLLNSNREHSNHKNILKINSKLPSFTPQIFTNFTKTNSHSMSTFHKKFNSTISQPNNSTQFSDFFKLTNVTTDKNTTTHKLININSSSDKLGTTSNKLVSNLSHKKNANSTSTLQKLSSQLNGEAAHEENRNFQLNNKDKLIEFVKTCNEENKISQYAYDVMGKFFKTAFPVRPIRKKFSAKKIENDDMFRLENAAKKYFILNQEKGLFISEDYGVNEVLNFTRRINGMHPIGSYKFRKIIGDRIGVNVLQEGNLLRLVTLKEPPDINSLKRNQKFSKQHDDIVNHLDEIISKKKSLKKREKDYIWKQN